LSVIQSLHANVIGADVVELNPTQDVSDVTEMVAAKVFKEIVAKML
jgi:arginase family enzyme